MFSILLKLNKNVRVLQQYLRDHTLIMRSKSIFLFLEILHFEKSEKNSFCFLNRKNPKKNSENKIQKQKESKMFFTFVDLLFLFPSYSENIDTTFYFWDFKSFRRKIYSIFKSNIVLFCSQCFEMILLIREFAELSNYSQNWQKSFVVEMSVQKNLFYEIVLNNIIFWM